MQCPKCQFENPSSAKFCMACGNQLTGTTPEFHETALEAERKHATVLFSDLAGYTALTEKLDPEEVKEIMGRIFAEASRILVPGGRLFVIDSGEGSTASASSNWQPPISQRPAST